MTTQYPTSKDNKVKPNAGDNTTLPTDNTYGSGHAKLHQFEVDSIQALETKVGVDGSADTSSMDYKLSGIGTGNKAIKLADIPDSATGTKGLVKMSYAPADSANPIAVGDNDPRIPTSGQGSALVGTTGVPSSTNKFVTQDNVYTGDYDQSQTTQNGTVAFGEANISTNKMAIAQSFRPDKTKIRGVKLYKSADTGTFTGTVQIDLMSDSGGSPSSQLATVTLTNAQWLALPVGEFEVDFTSEYASMVQGSTYWIKALASTADNSNHPNLGTNTAGGYANGSVKYYNATDGWTAISTIDLYFKTLQGKNSQIVQTDTSGKLPAFDGSQLTNTKKFKVGVVAYAGGTQTIAHGLSGIPKKVMITASSTFTAAGYSGSSFSRGAYDGTTQGCNYMYQYDSGSSSGSKGGGAGSDSSNIIKVAQSGAVTAICSVDTTNITLIWSGSTTNESISNILWEAEL